MLESYSVCFVWGKLKIIHEYGHVYIKFFVSLPKTMVLAVIKNKGNNEESKHTMPFQCFRETHGKPAYVAKYAVLFKYMYCLNKIK